MYLIATFEPGMQMIVGVNGEQQLWIPMNEENSDYQAYLAWVAEGNIAEEWNPNGNQ